VAGIALQAGVSLAATTTFTGAVETGDATAIDRIDRNGIATTCDSPTSYPGTVELFSPFRYDSHTVTNTGSAPVCLTATLTVTSAAPLHPIVYLGSFDPDDQSANYLADSGSSASAALGPVTFSFTLGAGETAVIILQEVGTDGVPSKPYSLTIDTPDSEPPVVTVPANITVPATGPDGAVVTFAVSANDETDGVLTPTCDRPSGSIFPVGTTTVTCSATDAALNTGTASFTVTVTGAADILAQLRADTIDLVINASAERALVASVDQAIQASNNRNVFGAYFALLKYVIQIDSYVDSRAVSPVAAQQLLMQARLALNAII
jgi:hypothetical protein